VCGVLDVGCSNADVDQAPRMSKGQRHCNSEVVLRQLPEDSGEVKKTRRSTEAECRRMRDGRERRTVRLLEGFVVSKRWWGTRRETPVAVSTS
jgi:hypothetical protein